MGKMEEIRKLEEKIKNKNNNNNKVEFDYVKAIDSFRADVKKVYDKLHNIENNLLKKMRYIDSKQDKLLELLQENNNNVDIAELQRQKEIAELEEKLRELKGENDG